MDTFIKDRTLANHAEVERAIAMAASLASRTIDQVAPAWLIEVHTIGLMFQIDALFRSTGYRLRLLAEHTPSRCLVLAERPGPDTDTTSS